MTVIDDYVATLGRALRGPRSVRRDMLAEARDSLHDTAEGHVARGLSPVEAERRAVEEFGPVREIAPAYQRELVAGQGRRTAALLFLTMPPTVLLWTLTWWLFPWPPAGASALPEWYGLVAGAVDGMQVLTALGAAGVLVVLGWGARRHVGRRSSPWLTRALGVVVLAKLPVLLALCYVLLSASGRPLGTLIDFTPTVIAFGVSLVFFICQVSSATRCLTTTRALANPPVEAGEPVRV
ncbi:permease prefix domain 1-containing protein [Sinosporangium siamense]|uniref:Uncharacterized protein n=1 Tax=Sinosporangium siamense TaxID=1367973 RepID=A0A919RH21_9ACTN|nr:permease prefix domain 1-containing protein [Sinosporangium siamense]GII93741.1 hypothetical protein Ssi02_39720 [Sinosporangium siamense]